MTERDPKESRKWRAFQYGAVFFLLAALAGGLKSIWPQVEADLMLQTAIGFGTFAGLYMGSNALHRQAEAKVEVAKVEAGIEDDA